MATITGYSKMFLGDVIISTGINAKTWVEGFNANFVSAGYSLSSNYRLFFNDLPFALYENSVGRRALAVVIDNTGTDNPYIPYATYNGKVFVIKHLNYKNTIGVKVGSDGNDLKKKLIWCGESIGLSDGNMVEMVQVTLPSVDEERSYMMNGTPMLARRSGHYWYMVFHSVT